MKKTQEINKTRLIGVIAEKIRLDSTHIGKEMYSTTLHIERISGAIDKIPIKIPKKSLEETKGINVGDTVLIEGELRTLDYLGEDKKWHLSIFVSAKKIKKNTVEEIEDYLASNNVVQMTGVICKEATLRYTPLGRKIADVTIAVDKEYKNISSYVPCVAWSRNAEYIYNLPVGTKISLVGRIQSRDYVKVIDEQLIPKTAIELSINSIIELYINKKNKPYSLRKIRVFTLIFFYISGIKILVQCVLYIKIDFLSYLV